MVRRTGIIDTGNPQIIQAPQLSSGAAEYLPQAYDQLARAAQSLQADLQPIVDNQTKERAASRAAAGDFERTGGLTRQDRIFNEVVDAGFLSQGAIDVDKAVTELVNQSLSDLDVDRFRKANEAAKAQYISGIDPRYRAPLAQAWDTQAAKGDRSIVGMATDRAIKRAREAMTARRSMILDSISGAADIADPDVATKLDELESSLNAEVAMQEMTPEEAAAIRGNAISKIEANRIANEAEELFIGGGRTDEAYKAAMEMLDTAIGSTDLQLSRTERASYLGAARSSLNAALAERRREERELAKEIRDAQREAETGLRLDLADAKLRAAQGFAPNDEEIRDLGARARATGNQSLADSVSRLAVTSAVQSEMRGLSIPQQEGYVTSLEAAAAAGDSYAASTLETARKVASSSRRAAEEDPVTYAAAQNGRQPVQINWSDPAATVETMRTRFMQAGISASQLGVGVKFFNPADRAQIRAMAEQGGPAAMALAGTIHDAADGAGVDPLKVFSEIASDGDAPLLAQAGALISSGAPRDTAARILGGREALRSDIVKREMPSQAVQGATQRNVLGDLAGRLPPAEVDAITRAADSYYAASVLKDGKSGGRAYEEAMRAVTGEWKDEAGKTWGGSVKTNHGQSSRVPSWIRQSTFPSIIKALTPDDIGAALSNTGYVDGRQARVSDYRNSYLIYAGPGLYYAGTEKPGPDGRQRVIVDADGQPVMLDFNRIRGALQQRFPGAVK